MIYKADGREFYVIRIATNSKEHIYTMFNVTSGAHYIGLQKVY